MNTTSAYCQTGASAAVRAFARAGSLTIAIGWLAAVFAEMFRNGLPAPINYLQLAPMSVIFAGYALGWRMEVVGGMLVLLGTVMMIGLNLALFPMLPVAGMVAFAVPGLSYLVAHCIDHFKFGRKEWRP